MGEGSGNGTIPLARRARVRAGRVRLLAALVAAGTLGATATVSASVAGASPASTAGAASEYRALARTPIKHLVVIFDENNSFDHYFGTYPHAANTDGTPFHARKGTPTVNGLTTDLLQHNPNEFNPRRLTHSEALTCDQDHVYPAEQRAFDGGKMDKFVQNTESDGCPGDFSRPGIVMDYFDGNTVTALWNYAQHYAMSDSNFAANFGPSTPGALNLISGDDGGGYAVDPATGKKVADPGAVGSLDANGVGTIYGDLDPFYDDCSDSGHTSTNPVGVMTGKNIGNLLNARHVTWGWFQGGFAPTSTSPAGLPVCGARHENIAKSDMRDYAPHHNPFEYYASTANPRHLAPTSEAAVGRTDRAAHQYDLSLFYQTLTHANLPAVSFLKAAAYQDGHAGYSDPLDEQHFIVKTVNAVESSPFWRSTAILITYDDSDGWYDHQASPIVNGSRDSALDTAMCESRKAGLGGRDDRCGFGPRLPLVVISPYTRPNYVSHNLTDQASVIRFIEDNWLSGERLPGGSFDKISGRLDAKGGVLDFRVRPHFARLILDPVTGAVRITKNSRPSRFVG